MAERLTETQPLVTDGSPRGRLLSTLVAQRGRGSSTSAAIAPDEAHRATEAGRQPVALTASQLETLRWGGLAFAPWSAGAGASVEAILDALPPGTVTLAVISADAAGRLSPRQWQALGRLGLRLPDAATGRAPCPRRHHRRARPGARGGAGRLRPARRAAGRRRWAARRPARPWTRVSRPMPHASASGYADRCSSIRWRAWRWCSSPRAATCSDGAPAPTRRTSTDRRSAAARRRRAVAVAALPCMTVPAGRDTDVTALTGSGALGVTWAAAGATRRDPGDGHASGRHPVVRLAETAPNASGPMLIGTARGPGAFTLQGRRSAAAGVYLRGPVARARARADHDVRLCAAWPMPLALCSRAAADRDAGRATLRAAFRQRLARHGSATRRGLLPLDVRAARRGADGAAARRALHVRAGRAGARWLRRLETKCGSAIGAATSAPGRCCRRAASTRGTYRPMRSGKA